MKENAEVAELNKDEKRDFLAEGKFGKKGFLVQSLDDLWNFVNIVTGSSLCPEPFRGKPADAFIAAEWGLELGLTLMNALNSIAVIKGRPALYGDAPKGLVDNSGLMDSFKEEFIGTEYDADFGVKVTSKRKNRVDPVVSTFAVADAKLAGLWDSSVTWKKYPKRMLTYRARAFNLRDNFPDVLKGIHIAEEVVDYEVVETNKPQSIADIESEILHDMDDNQLDDAIRQENNEIMAKMAKKKAVDAEVVEVPPEPVDEDKKAKGQAIIEELRKTQAFKKAKDVKSPKKKAPGASDKKTAVPKEEPLPEVQSDDVPTMPDGEFKLNPWAKDVKNNQEELNI